MGVDWKGIVGTVAPTLAAALGGPLAGAATKAISQAVLGKDDGGKPDIVAALATGDTSVLVKLKEAENAFAMKMEELGIDLEKIAAADRDSARKREATVGDNMPRILAVMIITAFISMIFAVLLGLSHVEGALAGTLIGYLSAKAEQVVTYYFGSSAGSSKKNDMMQDLLNKGGK